MRRERFRSWEATPRVITHYRIVVVVFAISWLLITTCPCLCLNVSVDAEGVRDCDAPKREVVKRWKHMSGCSTATQERQCSSNLGASRLKRGIESLDEY